MFSLLIGTVLVILVAMLVNFWQATRQPDFDKTYYRRHGLLMKAMLVWWVVRLVALYV